MMAAGQRGFEALRTLARAGRGGAHRCELCGLELQAEHHHLVDVSLHSLACACDGCALVLDGSGRFRRPGRAVWRLDGLRISAAEWEALGIPVQLAFVFRSSASRTLEAVYPSPAGATRSTPEPEAWKALAGRAPRISAMEEDVQALLVKRIGEPHRHLIVPIDECYHLIGLLRTSWRGFSGGDEVRSAMESFFAGLEARAEAA
jgi:hypothetical protein